MVKGSLNGVPFKTLLEPDGKYGTVLRPNHWLRPSDKLLKDAKAWVNPIPIFTSDMARDA